MQWKDYISFYYYYNNWYQYEYGGKDILNLVLKTENILFQLKLLTKIRLNLMIENYLITKNMITSVGLREKNLGIGYIFDKIEEILFPLKEETINYVN